MKVLRRTWKRLIGTFAGRQDTEFLAEVEAHLQMQIADNLRLGMPAAQARREALVKFGGIEAAREAYRDQRSLPWLDAFAQDLRFSVRLTRRNPAFTSTVVVLLALGVGAAAAIFSAVYAVILHPLPYPRPDSIAIVWIDHARKQIHETGTSYPTFLDWKRENRSFEDLSICSRSYPVTLTGSAEPERVESSLVSANLLPLMGVPPALGRVFSEDEERRGDHVVILSDSLWKRRFGASPEILGRMLQIEGRDSMVIGVMPPRFQFPTADTQFWQLYSVLPGWSEIQSRRFTNFWRVVGRLRSQVTPRMAQGDLDRIGQGLALQYPDLAHDPDFPGFATNVVPLPMQVARGDVRLVLWMLLAAVGVLLLIACSNLAALFLARDSARAAEIGIRRALGAGGTRIVRQILTEAAMFCVLGGASGTLVASVLIRLLGALAPANIPRLTEAAVNWPVVMFSLASSCLAGLLFAIGPAIRASGANPRQAFAQGSRTMIGGPSARLSRNVIVTGQVALAMVLMAGAGLMIHSYLQVQATDPGFAPERVLSLRVVLWSRSEPQRAAFYDQVLARIQSLPDVERAAWVSNAFFSYNPDTTIIVEHRPSSAQSNEQVMDDVASPAYFQTLGTALYRGRFFGDQDTVRSTPVAIVNNTMARRFWPNADPIGERFRTYPDEPWRTVVGVVADMRRSGLEREPISQFFLPAAQAPSRGMDLVVRTRQVSTGLANTIRSEIRAVDASVPVFRVSTLEQQMNEFMGLRRFQTLLIALFAAAALVLSAIGVFGLMHYSALQRKREIGLRLALGAQSWEVLSMMMAQGLRLVLAGSGIGILGGIWLVRLISALLYNVGPADPVSWLSAGGILLVAGAAASYLPARRAAAADPLASLHENG